MSTRLIDCRNHSLTVFDGADRVGSLVERDGCFQAFDLAGVSHGTFDKVAAAARALPKLSDQRRALPEVGE
jgi:hypothetical protein